MTTESDHGVSRTVLPGGLRVVTESLPAVRSVALGIWVGVGSRDEDQAHAGATHYLEHLLFKGTRRRTALEISAEMDAAGGEMNAFTAKEYTCYYARVLDADLPLAVDILSDMVTSSLITPKDVDAERNVVLEEIAMNDDDPSTPCTRRSPPSCSAIPRWARPILGTTDSINAITSAHNTSHATATTMAATSAAASADQGQVRGSIVLSLEDPSSRMSRLGKSELVYPRLEPVEEVLSAIDSVASHDDIRAIAADILTRPKTLAVVGPFDDASPFQA